MATQAHKPARFWIYANGDLVRLTLQPGESLTHATYQRHDEGYFSSVVTWRYDGEYLTAEFWYKSRDCDGLSESWGDCQGTIPPDRSMPVEWAYGPPSTRDYTAEAAGY